MPHLNSSSGAGELQCWVDHWSAQYPISSDTPIDIIATSHNGSLNLQNLIEIFNWKLEARFRANAIAAIQAHDRNNPGDIRGRTSRARVAKTDFEAVEHLRGLPQMATPPSIAVASCLLMVLDQSRWTVMDRMANTSLVALKKVLSPLETRKGELRSLFCALSSFSPSPPDFLARDLDWGIYLQACREIARLSGRDLRTIDRALFESRGDLYFECGSTQGSSQSHITSVAPSDVLTAAHTVAFTTPTLSTEIVARHCADCFLRGLRNWLAVERSHVKQITRDTNYSDGKSFSDAYSRGYVQGTRGRQTIERNECLHIGLFPTFWAARVATGAVTENDYRRPVEGAFRHAPPCKHC